MIKDLRGTLAFGEVGQQLPFEVKRIFTVFDVPSKDVRGEHAHRELHQFLICVKGSCAVVIDDGEARDEVILESPSVGLHIPPMVWGIPVSYTHLDVYKRQVAALALVRRNGFGPKWGSSIASKPGTTNPRYRANACAIASWSDQLLLCGYDSLGFCWSASGSGKNLPEGTKVNNATSRAEMNSLPQQ